MSRACRPPRPARPSPISPANARPRWSQRLLAAGAVLIGKTNLDQFATGLVGTRSPYGALRLRLQSRLHQRRLQFRFGGGGGGRPGRLRARHRHRRLGPRPRGLQPPVGLKPTKGRWSTRGVVPACRSLDCVSVFTATAADAARGRRGGRRVSTPRTRIPAGATGAAGAPRRASASASRAPTSCSCSATEVGPRLFRSATAHA